jgi:3-methyladenine DNA glycosylase Tag
MPQTIEATNVMALSTNVMALSRCGWATADPIYIAYHDREWGTPLHDDRGLFELLILEGAQAGLSWITILRNFIEVQRHFGSFDTYIWQFVNHTPVQNSRRGMGGGLSR